MAIWEKARRLEIIAGRYGFYNVLNGDRVPLGGLVTLLNATLADRAWRTGGGATLLGVPTTGGPKAMAAIDYWPTLGQQRTVVASADGTIQRDDGNGHNWANLKVGLGMNGAVPMFSVAGGEQAGSARKLFYADRVNAPLYGAGDAAALIALDSLNADWGGVNQPGWFCPHQGYHWAGGNPNSPHSVYRSTGTNHADFGTQPYRIICGPLPNQERTVGAISLKGGLIVFCYPVGTYFIDTTTDPNPANWFAALVTQAGAAGPRAFAQEEEDVAFVSSDLSWHSLSSVFGQQKASVRATDLSYPVLTDWAQQNVNLAASPSFDLLYYAARRELMLSYAPAGSLAKSRRLHADLNGVAETGGPQWVRWDRDANEALFLRKVSGTLQIPAMVDAVGQVWLLDRAARSANGQGYRFEFFLEDTDFGAQGRKWNGRFFQVQYVATAAFTLTVETWQDGRLTQTFALSLQGGGATLPIPLPFQLTGLVIQTTPPQPLLGQFERLALRGYVTAAVDCVITKLIVGCELSAS